MTHFIRESLSFHWTNSDNHLWILRTEYIENLSTSLSVRTHFVTHVHVLITGETHYVVRHHPTSLIL